jgi:hypothetical protein
MSGAALLRLNVTVAEEPGSLLLEYTPTTVASVTPRLKADDTDLVISPHAPYVNLGSVQTVQESLERVTDDDQTSVNARQEQITHVDFSDLPLTLGSKGEAPNLDGRPSTDGVMLLSPMLSYGFVTFGGSAVSACKSDDEVVELSGKATAVTIPRGPTNNSDLMTVVCSHTYKKYTTAEEGALACQAECNADIRRLHRRYTRRHARVAVSIRTRVTAACVPKLPLGG